MARLRYFIGKCLKMGSPGGSRRGPANHLFATFFSLVSHGVPGGPWLAQMLPTGAKTTPQCFPRVSKRPPRDCQNAPPGVPKRSPGGPMGRITFRNWALPLGSALRVEGTVAGTPQAIGYIIYIYYTYIYIYIYISYVSYIFYVSFGFP